MKKIKAVCLVLLACAVLLSIVIIGNREWDSRIPRSLRELQERNPETKEFVRGYSNHVQSPVDLSGYDRENIPLFLQWDPQWGYENYGSDMMAITGCGPTALAMVGFYLTGDPAFSPDQVAHFAEQNGYYRWGHGSSWTLISEGGEKLGLSVEEIPLWEPTILEILQNHHPIICAVGPGDFTSDGHYIVLTGEENGKISVNDPNSKKNSQKLWTYENLAPQIQNLWVLS